MGRKPKVNKTQETAVKRLKARGFGFMDNTPTGITLGLVDSENFFVKIKVDRNGKMYFYRNIKAREFHKQRLPHIDEPFKRLPSGNIR